MKNLVTIMSVAALMFSGVSIASEVAAANSTDVLAQAEGAAAAGGGAGGGSAAAGGMMAGVGTGTVAAGVDVAATAAATVSQANASEVAHVAHAH